MRRILKIRFKGAFGKFTLKTGDHVGNFYAGAKGIAKHHGVKVKKALKVYHFSRRDKTSPRFDKEKKRESSKISPRKSFFIH